MTRVENSSDVCVPFKLIRRGSRGPSAPLSSPLFVARCGSMRVINSVLRAALPSFGVLSGFSLRLAIFRRAVLIGGEIGTHAAFHK